MSYQAVQEQLAAGVPAEALCATCPWDRLCVQPPSMTRDEVDQKMQEMEQKAADRQPDGEGKLTGMIVGALAFAGRDTVGAMCPVFALRLRSDRRVADVTREMMRSWGEY